MDGRVLGERDKEQDCIVEPQNATPAEPLSVRRVVKWRETAQPTPTERLPGPKNADCKASFRDNT